MVPALQHHFFVGREQAELEVETERVPIGYVVHVLVGPFEDQFDLLHSRIELLLGKHALLFQGLFQAFYLELDGLTASRLQEVEVDLEGVLVLPKELHKFQNQHLHLR